MPPIDLAALLDDKEENLKLWQTNVTHASIMDLLGDPSNPLYAEPHSIAEHYDAMLVGARALGDLPEHTHCRDSGVTARVHEDEAQQVCQKILKCLDMRVMDGDLVVPTCLRTPTLILLARRFVQLYYDPDAQGQYASHFPTRGQHRGCQHSKAPPAALSSGHGVAADGRAWPYDSDDSVLNLDEEYLDLAEWVVQWWAARQSTACTPPWRPSDFSRPEQSHFQQTA